MLFLEGQPFIPLKMDKAGNEGGSGGSDGASGGGKKPNPDGKGDNPPGGDGQGGEGGEDDDLSDDDSKWTPEQTKSYLKKMRKENASYRKRFKDAETKNVDLEARLGKIEGGLKNVLGEDPEEKESVEDKIARLEKRELARDEQKAIDDMNRVVEKTAKALGVSDDGMDFFKFLLQQEAEKMDDDAEIPEKVMLEIAQKVIAQAGTSEGSTTSADGKGGKPNPKPQGKGSGVTVAQFANMTIAERSALYQKNKDEYEKLMAQAKQEKLFI